MLRTANPAMKPFAQPQTWDALAPDAPRTMTIGGTVQASTILIGICGVAAVLVWGWLHGGSHNAAMTPLMLGSAIGGFLLAMVIVFKPRTAPFLSPLYAVIEGVFVGVISFFVPTAFGAPEGVVIQAVLLTFGIFAALLMAYASGLVRLGSTATKVVTVATGGIAIYYLLGFVLGMVGLPIIQLGWDSGPIGIGFSVVVVILASLNLVLDFQFIEAGVQRNAPKHMEWYGAFGLLVTLVWLYIEVLRLLAKLQSRD